MRMTEEDVANTAFDLEKLVWDYQYHGEHEIDDDDIKTLRDAILFLRSLRFYAD